MAHSTSADWIAAAIWGVSTFIACFQWYWQGRRDQRKADAKMVDLKVNELVERMDGMIERHMLGTDPNRPKYLDRQ